MTVRRSIWWGVVIAVLAALNVLAAVVGLRTPRPEPVGIREDIALSPPDVSAATAEQAPPGGTTARRVKHFLDTQQVIGRHYVLSGWVLVTDQATQGQEVFVQLWKPDGSCLQYATVPVERPDVGRAMKSPLYDHAGFRAVIPLAAGLDFKACTVGLLVKNKAGLCESGRFKPALRQPPPRVKKG